MAHNNFTPITFGALATSDSINAPMEQLSNAIDSVRLTAQAAQNTADAVGEKTDSMYGQLASALFADSNTSDGSRSKKCNLDLSAYYGGTIRQGMILVLRLLNGNYASQTQPITLSINSGTAQTIEGFPTGTFTGHLYLLMVYAGSCWHVLTYHEDTTA